MPVVNMVAICQLLDQPSLWTKSLHNVLNESPNDYSEGSTKTISSCPAFPSGFGGMIFHVSHDSATKDGQTTDEHKARRAKNADRQHYRDAEASRGGDEDAHGPPHRGHNLEEEFDMLGDQ